MGDGIFYGALIAGGLAVGGCFIHMDRTIADQEAQISALKTEVEAARDTLAKLSAWQAGVEDVMRGHAQTVQKQEAEFRSLRAKVKDAYKDKEVRNWGDQPVPLAVRSLLEGKDGK